MTKPMVIQKTNAA